MYSTPVDITRRRRVILGKPAAPFVLLCAALEIAFSGDVHGQGTAPDPRWQALFERPAEIPAPADNSLTPEKVALGAKLFADARLSGDNARSCASCHRPELSFTDGRRRARGRDGKPLLRNTPALWNLAWGRSFSWDGRAPTLEAQVAIPIADADEMAGDWTEIVRRLQADIGLASAFAAAFPQEPAVSQASIVKALASYVRSLVSPPTRFDAWISGDTQALSRAEARGFALFTGKGGCVLCHAGWRFTDDRLHDIGLSGRDRGQGAASSGGEPGVIAFKTPGLREAAYTAPYMHDGSLATLSAVLGHYGGGFRRRPSLAPHLNRALRLSTRERAELLAFLRALSSEKDPTRVRQAGPN